MSTKIYDAYALPSGIDPLVANLAVSKAIRATYRQLALLAVGCAAVLLYDDTVTRRVERVDQVVNALNGFANVGVEDVSKALHPYAVDDHRVSHLRLAAAIVQALNAGGQTLRILHGIDLEFAVSWMVDPQPNADGGHDHYAKIYTERPEYKEAFLAATGASDFHYQNQADQPDDVTEEQWEHRKTTWERVIPGLEAPASFSPSWELTDVKRLEFETWGGKWLNAAAVCDELEAAEVLRSGVREKLEAWLPEGPPAPEQVEL